MAIKQVFINRSKHPQEVQLVLANGSVDSMNLQPGGRASPPPGSKVDPSKEASYLKSFLVVHALPDNSIDAGESTA